MTKFHQGYFIPKNPKKLVGNAQPFARSGWEFSVMTLLDNHPNVINWASESIKIPYRNPLTGKQTVYIPDFFILYQDKNGKQRAELIEVKPKKETFLEHARNKKDKMALVLNMAKWKACLEFCHKNHITFRVLNEDQIFINKGSNLKNKAK